MHRHCSEPSPSSPAQHPPPSFAFPLLRALPQLSGEKQECFLRRPSVIALPLLDQEFLKKEAEVSNFSQSSTKKGPQPRKKRVTVWQPTQKDPHKKAGASHTASSGQPQWPPASPASPPLRGAHRAGARATSLPVLRRERPRALPSGESSREDGSSPRAGTATGRAAFREDCWEHRHSPAPSGGASPFQVPPSGSPKPRFPKWRTARTRPCRSSRFPALLGRGPGG